MLALNRPKGSVTGLALVILIAIANPGVAAPGDLDTTFDTDGRVTTDFQLGSDEAHGVAIQTDGKIVAGGSATCGPCDAPTLDFAVARYRSDGSLDATFGGDGTVATDFGGGLDQAFAVAIQTDGKIVAGGAASTSGVDFALARYNTDGSLDPTFDGDGRVTTDYGFGSSQIYGLAIQGDGKIVAAGYGPQPHRTFSWPATTRMDPSTPALMVTER